MPLNEDLLQDGQIGKIERPTETVETSLNMFLHQFYRTALQKQQFQPAYGIDRGIQRLCPSYLHIYTHTRSMISGG
jgi:hypothetical protein